MAVLSSSLWVTIGKMGGWSPRAGIYKGKSLGGHSIVLQLISNRIKDRFKVSTRIHIYPDFPFLICLLQKSPMGLVLIDYVHKGAESRADMSAALDEDDPGRGDEAW
jgi:hypothetical protein